MTEIEMNPKDYVEERFNRLVTGIDDKLKAQNRELKDIITSNDLRYQQRFEAQGKELDKAIDKTLLFDGGSIGWLFLLVKGYFASYCTENRWLAMRFGKEGGSVAALLRNQLPFWSSHPTRGFDKTLLSRSRSVGGLFLLVNGYFASKAGAGDAIGKGRWSGISPTGHTEPPT